MPMKNPVPPVELVRANLEELGLSVAAAARGLGVMRMQHYYEYRRFPLSSIG